MLKAQPISIRILEPQLPHPIRRNFRLFHIDPMRSEVLVSAVEILTPEKQASIVVGSDAYGIGYRWTLVFLIGSVEHHLRAMESKSGPVTVVSWLRRAPNFESQHVAVKTNRGRHVENLQQRGNTVNIHGHTILLVWQENISEDFRVANRPTRGRSFGR